MTALGYNNEIKSEGQFQGLNLYGLEDIIHKLFYTVHLWVCGSENEAHPTPWEIRRNSCSSLCLSAQVFFPVLLLRNCRLCCALKNRCLGLFHYKLSSLLRKLQSKDPHKPSKPGIPSLSVSTLQTLEVSNSRKITLKLLSAKLGGQMFRSQKTNLLFKQRIQANPLAPKESSAICTLQNINNVISVAY